MAIDTGQLPQRDGIRYVFANAERPVRRATGEGGTGASGLPGIAHIGDRLAAIARPGMRVVIAFTDATRHAPDALLIGHLLDELAACGVPPDAVTLLCATGLHRPMTARERVDKLGAHLAATMRVVDHDALAPDLVSLGDFDGLPVVVNRLCAEADLLIATGVVEPHQYAGYSGGAKTVAIGCAGEATIAATHGPAMLDRAGVRLGRIDGNPFQEFVRAAGRRIGLRYVANALLDPDGALVAVVAGTPDRVHDELAALGRAMFAAPVERPVHMALLGVSAAKGANLYQASRAITYVALADRSPLLDGAPIVLDASLPEGAGQGLGERRFAEILAASPSPAALIAELKRTGFPGGAQRAYILAQALLRHPAIVVAPGREALVRACHMEHAPDLPTALDRAARIAREKFAVVPAEPLRCLVLPNALVTLPVLDG